MGFEPAYDSMAVAERSVLADRDKRESVLAHIDGEINRLSVTITELEQRLHPVLSPFAMVEEMTDVARAPQSLIRDQRDSLSTQVGRLQRLLDQLEV